MGPGSLRASDRDRSQVVEVLHRAATEGYLTLDEFEERVGQAYQSRYLGELEKLVADIPGAVPVGGPPRLAPSMRGGNMVPGHRPFRVVRLFLTVLAVMIVASVVVHLWLPLLIVGLIFWHRGWRFHHLRRFRRRLEII